jgi:hypothetical protein
MRSEPVRLRHSAFTTEHFGQLRKARCVRAVADVQFSPWREDWDEWMAYEALTNLAYSHLPGWVVCTYDANRLIRTG